jgi:hypothetical protein
LVEGITLTCRHNTYPPQLARYIRQNTGARMNTKKLLISFAYILLLVIPFGCATLKYEKPLNIHSGEDVFIDSTAVTPAYNYPVSPFEMKNIYGPGEQEEFVQDLARLLKNNNVFRKIGLNDGQTDSQQYATNITINFHDSRMGIPEPVLYVSASLRVQGEKKLGMMNTHQIVSDSKFGAFMNSGSQKHKISYKLTEAVINDIEQYIKLNSSPTIASSGILVTPPKGEGWSYMARNPSNVFDMAIGKQMNSPTHSFYVATNATQLAQPFKTKEDFQNFTSAISKASYNTERFKIIRANIESDERFGDKSVKYHYLIEDSTAPNSQGKISHMEVSGYYFIHPDDDKKMVSVFYSERYLEKERDPALQKQGESFIDSVRFKE